jgi:hypothetical protein
MKYYIGAIDVDDFLKSKNSKSYRDYYIKCIHDLEANVKAQKMRLGQIKVGRYLSKINLGIF